MTDLEFNIKGIKHYWLHAMHHKWTTWGKAEPLDGREWTLKQDRFCLKCNKVQRKLL